MKRIPVGIVGLICCLNALTLHAEFGDLLWRHEYPGAALYQVEYSGDGQIVCININGRLLFFGAQSGNLIDSLAWHKRPFGISFDGRLIANGDNLLELVEESEDGYIFQHRSIGAVTIQDRIADTVVQTLVLDTLLDPVEYGESVGRHRITKMDVAFSPSAPILAVSHSTSYRYSYQSASVNCDDGRINLYDANSWKPIGGQGTTPYKMSLQFSISGEFLLAHGDYYCWERFHGDEPEERQGIGLDVWKIGSPVKNVFSFNYDIKTIGHVLPVAIHPENSTRVVLGTHGIITVTYSDNTKREIASDGTRRRVRAIDFIPATSNFFVVWESGLVDFWNAETGVHYARRRLTDDAIVHAAFSSDHRQITVILNNSAVETLEWQAGLISGISRGQSGEERFQPANLYPQPSTGSIQLEATLAQATPVQLEIFASNGMRIASTSFGWLDAGTHNIQWDGSQLAAGWYMYRLRTNDGGFTGKLFIVK